MATAPQIVLNTDARVSFGGAAWTDIALTGPGFTASTWPGYPLGTPAANLPGRNVFCSPTLKQSTTAGQTCTVTVDPNVVAVYMITAREPSGGPFNVTLNGTALGGTEVVGNAANPHNAWSCHNANPILLSSLYRYNRVFMPIFRKAAPSQSTQTLVITNPASNVTVQTVYNVGTTTWIAAPYAKNVYVDGFLFIYADSKVAATPGVYAAVGDSWTAGYGAYNTDLGGFPSVVAKRLQAATGQYITWYNFGTASDKLYAFDAGNRDLYRERNCVGGMYRLFSEVYPVSPQYITLEFGRSDMYEQGQNTPEDWALHTSWMLQLTEDLFDVTGAKGVPVQVSYSNPPFLPIAQLGLNQIINNVALTHEVGELAAGQTRDIVKNYQWCGLADLYSLTKRTARVMWPNWSLPVDRGSHLNDSGHGLVGVEHARALLHQ